MTNYLEQILTLFKNIVLNSVGAERDLYQLLQDKDVERAISLMQDRDKDVDEALREYNPQTHSIMRRANKRRKNVSDYVTEKLPRSRQRYINETELFFLFGNDVVWSKKEGDNDAFKLFSEFLDNTFFNSRMRTAKRLAGAETESAKLYNLYKDKNDKLQCNVTILARSTGYKLRPMFDRYGAMVAFAYGYEQKQGNRVVKHWDIQTADFLFYCQKGRAGWEVDIQPNPTGKINVIYYRQPKAWEGVDPRIAREEMLDSKIGDSNNYFADPIAVATADVVQLMSDPDASGKLIQMKGDGSRFEYINPPQASQLQQNEREALKESILFDTFTPDFSFEALRGMGTLSGAAIRNSMILGYIKRARYIEVYKELLFREKNLIIEILKYQHPEMNKQLSELVIDFEFSEPFPDDVETKWNRIQGLYSAGLVSLETAVNMLALTDSPEEEIDRIQLASMEMGEMDAGQGEMAETNENDLKPTTPNNEPQNKEAEE